MKLSYLAIFTIFISVFAVADQSRGAARYVTEQKVIWSSLGENENDSVPLGNGDLAANVWTEKSGDVVLLLAKADAWTETGQLVKLGRVRVTLSPNPFALSTDFSQTLDLETATLTIRSGTNVVVVWVDANHSVVHVEAHLDRPSILRAGAEFWRHVTASGMPRSTAEDSRIMSGEAKPHTEPDIVFPAAADRVSWCHYNPTSNYPYLLKQEHLEGTLGKDPDPLLHRCFGVALLGPDLVSAGNQVMQSAAPGQDLRVDIVAHSEKQADSPEAWQVHLNAEATEISHEKLEEAKAGHDRWWREFWDRSWVHVTGNDDAAKVTQGYFMQRYMMACSSRGELPPKFNGGLFTVGHESAATTKPSKADHDPDYRAWGDSYWNQNNRLLYWPLIATGDFDLMKPWFGMYVNGLALAKERTDIYYHHAGAHFPETMLFWGLPNLHDFGENNATNEIQSAWQRYHVQGSLEVIAQMLDVYDCTQESEFARSSLVPFSDAIITFYDQHYARDANGKIRMAPAQSLETYQLLAVNPTPDIAGLMSVIPRLLALPHDVTTEVQRAAWAKTLKDLPSIPVGKTARGKVPPLGKGDPEGIATILPAEEYGKTGNSENPELYVAFPYRIYGVGKSGLTLARDTFAARRSPQNTCWGQDGPQAAVLGLTAVAQQAVVAEFTNYGDQRFKWFWKPGHDWIPDLDNGGDGMIGLQLMLMQCDGDRIQILPAWPADWNADFKLWAPHQTTVEGHVENGKITLLKVIPEFRAKDVSVERQ